MERRRDRLLPDSQHIDLRRDDRRRGRQDNSGSGNLQNEKFLSIRENTLNVGAAHGLAPLVSMPADDYFRMVAGEPQLAAAIRVEATFPMFHHGEIKNADEHATRLQDRLRAYLDTFD